jgi:hypothetical protein
MNIRSLIVPAATATAALALAASLTAQEAQKPKDPPAAAETAAAAAPKSVAPGVQLGKAETARWTPTTYEAATAEVNKKVLESGKIASITGEVVDVSCYMQLGKRGEAHIACGSKCIENGEPIGLLDAEDNLYIVFAEEHHPRRDGEVSLRKAFLPHLAKTITVTGMATEMKGYRALFVQAAELDGMTNKAYKKAQEAAPPGAAEKK